MVQQLLDAGAAYVVDDLTTRIFTPASPPPTGSATSRTIPGSACWSYLPSAAATRIAPASGTRWMPSCGGRPGRGARVGCPVWGGPAGWHVECSAIATNRLGSSFAIQGGGSDLIFPHHEFSAAHAEAALASPRMAEHYVHTGMISLDGVKMSKSLGNLVFVSKLTEAGHDPSAIRLGVYLGHYRSESGLVRQGVVGGGAPPGVLADGHHPRQR